MNKKEVETLILDKELEERYINERKKISKNIEKKIKRKRKFKLFFYRIILIASLIVFFFSAYKVAIWLVENYQNGVIKSEMRNIAKIDNSAGGDEVNPPDNPNESYKNALNLDLLNATFDELIARNKDTVAWIDVAGTDVKYPVVQSSDNSYYLSHSFDKSFNSAGWIFSDYRNNFNDLNHNSVIYGHGRLDGSMFGSLRRVFEDSWKNNIDNYVINLSTPKYNSSWLIFSTYYIKSEAYYITTEFGQDEEFKEFIDTIKGRSNYDFKTDVNTEDKILTLSTCKNDYGDRIVIHAKLIKKENKE